MLLDQIGDTGETVQLAISHTAAEYVMPKALVLMHRSTSAPVEVLIANSSIVKRMVRAGEADVGVAACTPNEVVEGVVAMPLLDDDIAAALPDKLSFLRRFCVLHPPGPLSPSATQLLQALSESASTLTLR